MKLKKLLTYVPGIGLIKYGLRDLKQRRGRKPFYDLRRREDRKSIGIYFTQILYLGFALSSKFIVGTYVGNGVSHGQWDPIKHIEHIFTNENKSKLEKTINLTDSSKINFPDEKPLRN